MAFDARTLLERRFAPIAHAYTWRDTVLYALGVGLGFEPLDPGALRYLYEGSDGDALQALPTLANVLAYPGFWVRDSGADWRRLLHAEQRIQLHAPLPASGRVVSRRTSALERGVVVLDHACVELKETPT